MVGGERLLALNVHIFANGSIALSVVEALLLKAVAVCKCITAFFCVLITGGFVPRERQILSVTHTVSVETWCLLSFNVRSRVDVGSKCFVYSFPSLHRHTCPCVFVCLYFFFLGGGVNMLDEVKVPWK